MYKILFFTLNKYCIARKFGRELNLAVWWISQPATKLKSANIKSFLYLRTQRWSRIAEQIGECDLCTNLVPSITRSNHFYRVLILQGSSMAWSPNTMMPPYALLHTICSIMMKPLPQRSQAHMHMRSWWSHSPQWSQAHMTIFSLCSNVEYLWSNLPPDYDKNKPHLSLRSRLSGT